MSARLACFFCLLGWTAPAVWGGTPGTGYESPNGASGDGATGIEALDAVGDDNGVGVYLYSGEVTEESTDLRIKGAGFDFEWKRKYRSREARDSEQGNNWDFSYNIYVENDIGTEITLCNGNARCDTFGDIGNDCWAKAGFFLEICKGADNSYTVTHKHRTRWKLAALDGSAAQGKIREIVDRNGNSMRFSYDSSGRLTTIYDTLDPITPPAPLAEDSLATSCVTDGDCQNASTCIGGRCYVGKNRYLSIEPNQASGSMTALRVTSPTCLDEEHWVGLPAEIPASGSGFWVSRLSPTPVYADWSTYPQSFHISDGEIIPEQVYRVQAIFDGDDSSDEGAYSSSLLLPTGHDGDVSDGGNPVGAPDGTANLGDANIVVGVFNGTISAPLSWVDLDGEVPNGLVNFADVLQAVRGFQNNPYQFYTPASCNECPVSCDDGDPCTTDTCVSGVCTFTADPTCTPQRDIAIAYNNDGLIESVTDFAGRQVTYAYYGPGDPDGSEGDLKSVTYPPVVYTPDFPIPPGHEYPNGKTWVYTYDKNADANLNGNLRSITDAKGQEYLANHYGTGGAFYDRVVRQEYGPAEFNYFYDINASRVITVVNDRMGNVEHLEFDDENRLVSRKEYTGRAVASATTSLTLNRPMNPLRPGEPEFFETTFDYNNQHSLTEVVFPRGNSIIQGFDDASVRQRSRGNMKFRLQLPGTIPSDQAEICERWSHDKVFNRWHEYVDGRGEKWIREIDSSGGYDTLLSSCQQTAGAVASLPEPEAIAAGGGDTGNVDEQVCPFPESFQEESGTPVTCYVFEYNPRGQLTEQTRLCDTRKEVIQYPQVGAISGYPSKIIRDADGEALETNLVYDQVGNLISETDPNGNDALFVFNQLNQVVKEFSKAVTIAPGQTVRYQREYFYDANDLLARIDIQVVDENGLIAPNTHFSTIYEYDELDNKIRTCKEVGGTGIPLGDLNLPASKLDCSGLASPGFITEEMLYDDNDNLTVMRFGESVNGNQPFNIVETLYDERDLVFQKIKAPGDTSNESVAQTDYDLNGNEMVFTSGVGSSAPQQATKVFDGFDRYVSKTDAEGNVWTGIYDENGNLVEESLVGEEVEGVSGVDSTLGRVVYEIDGWNRVWRRLRDHFIVENGTVTTIPDGTSQTIFSYNSQSQLDLIRDDNLDKFELDYDSANRLQLITGPEDNTREVTLFDSNGNALEVTETDVSQIGSADEIFVTTRVFDELDRLVSTTDNLNRTNTYKYDSRGNVVVTIDALNHQVRNYFDGQNRKTAEVIDLDGDGADIADSDDIVMRQIWDDSSRLIELEDDNGNKTQYAYDSLNRVIVERFADGSMHQVGSGATWSSGQATPDLTTFVTGYDVHGNRLSATDANGTVMAATYDDLNRVTGRAITAGSGVSNDTTFEEFRYDGLSRLVFAQDDDSTISRVYDSLGNIVSESLLHGQSNCGNGIVEPGETCDPPSGDCSGSCRATTTSACCTEQAGAGCGDATVEACVCAYQAPNFEYCCQSTWDAACAQAVVDSGCGVCPQPMVTGITTTAEYDGDSNVKTCTYPGGRVVNTQYDALDRIESIDGVYLDYIGPYRVERRIVSGASVSYGYDQVRRNINVQSKKSFTVLDDWGFQYDDMDNMTQRSNLRIGEMYDYEYDDAYRLMKATETLGSVNRQATYQHDGVNNRTNVIGSPDAGPYVGSYTMNAGAPDFDLELNQYSATPFDQRMYDSNGNLTERAAIGGGSLIARYKYDYRDQMVEAIDDVASKNHEYSYDALGRRIAKRIDVGSANTEVRYFYGGQQFAQVLEEQDGTGATQATYVFGNYIDQPLSMTRGANKYQFVQDANYNVTVALDNNGNVFERYDYGDFGLPDFQDAAGDSYAIQESAIGNPYAFTGRRFDVETGNYWYRTRYYDPIGGRFVSRDSIGTWGDPAEFGNGYSYVGNAPWSWIDPWGEGRNPGGAGGLHPKGAKEIVEVIKDLQRVGKGAKRLREWQGHWNRFRKKQKAVEKMRESIKKMPKKTRKQLEKAIEKQQKWLDGHEKEMRQKWPDLMEILCGKG